MDRSPPPDPGPWAEVEEPAARLRQGLTELYGFYEREQDMLASILRDAEIHPLTRELFELRAGETMMEIHRILADPLRGPRALAALGVALDFHTWRGLATAGLANEDAVETMVTAILAQP
jgi:hypothetical protein